MTSLPDDSVRELSDDTVELTLPTDPVAVRMARGFVAERWHTLDDDVLGDVELIVTELVSNAIKHGAPEITLRLRNQPFAIDVAVLDHGAGWPRRKSADEVRDQGSGRGLAIVDRLAAAWGADPIGTGAGKIVWASIDRL